MIDSIYVKGARAHNLKNIDVSIPHHTLTIITGVSGSGKSSLAFDTIYAEGQRRYVESLSAYARQFLGMMQKPEVDSIEGLSPAISIEQKTTSKNPRSTVGTITEIYDYMRLLWTNIGVPHSPTTGEPIKSQTIPETVEKIASYPEGSKIYIMSPIIRNRKGEHKTELLDLKKKGFTRVHIDNTFFLIDEVPPLEKNIKHTINVVVDRLVIKEGLERRLSETVETAFNISDGLLYVFHLDSEKMDVFSQKFSCPVSGFTIENLEPRLFSFNSPFGACEKCSGLGIEEFVDPKLVVPDVTKSIFDGAIKPWASNSHNIYKQSLEAVLAFCKEDLHAPFVSLSDTTKHIILYGSGDVIIPIEFKGASGTRNTKKPFEGVIPNLERRYRETDSQFSRHEISFYLGKKTCPQCQGLRLNEKALAVKINKKHIADACALHIEEATTWFSDLSHILKGQEAQIASPILKEIVERLKFLNHVGLDYLTLDRASMTLSGGESQRIRLASQIGSGLVGVLYVLDEPSIGLHQRDNDRLLEMLQKLKALGNTVLVVEHDLDAIKMADYLIDMGPRAGVHGGEIIAAGTPEEVFNNPNSLTAAYVTGKKEITVPKTRRQGNGHTISLIGAKKNNLKNVSIDIPLGTMTCVTGVSGSGKSTLILDTLFHAAQDSTSKVSSYEGDLMYDDLKGISHIDKVIDIDQSPIGRTPRSNPATYTGAFTPIREWFAKLPEALARGYNAGRFSFNVKGGRCETCNGEGVTKIEMHFLADVYVECDTCKGKRYNKDTLDIKFKEFSIADVLDLTIDEATDLFKDVPQIYNILSTLQQVGLGYIKVGQSATTLSGGEAQRVKLAKELCKKATGKTLYILDEPTTGLHFEDVNHLLKVLHALTDHGNTVVIIEHNLDVIKTADYLIDMGPEGGLKGGEVVATGTPEDVAQNPKSHTGRYLKPYLT